MYTNEQRIKMATQRISTYECNIKWEQSHLDRFMAYEDTSSVQDIIRNCKYAIARWTEKLDEDKALLAELLAS